MNPGLPLCAEKPFVRNHQRVVDRIQHGFSRLSLVCIRRCQFIAERDAIDCADHHQFIAEIAQMATGAVAVVGRHEQLLQSTGLYAEIYYRNLRE